MPVTQHNNFDAIRLIAAWLVFISHMHALVGLPEPSVLGVHSFGAVGVIIFFSVSGCLVTRSWLSDPDWRRFAARRLLRVWPGYTVAILVGSLLIAPFFYGDTVADWFGSTGFWKNLSNIVLLRPHYHPAVFDGHPWPALNGSLWSIPLEVWCYCGLLLGCLALARRIRFLAAIVVVSAVVAYLFALGGYQGHVPERLGSSLFISLMLACFFIAGMLFALWPTLLASRKAAWALALATVLAVAAGEYALAFLLALPWLVLRLGQASWSVLRHAGNHGDFSYGVYLYAWPMQQLSVAALGKGAPLVQHFLLAGGLTMLTAWLSWHLIEERALRYKPAKTVKPSPLPSDAVAERAASA